MIQIWPNKTCRFKFWILVALNFVLTNSTKLPSTVKKICLWLWMKFNPLNQDEILPKFFKCPYWSFIKWTPAVDVMMTIFCDFRQFLAKNLAHLFLKNQSYDQHFAQFSFIWSQNTNFWRFFWQKYFKSQHRSLIFHSIFYWPKIRFPPKKFQKITKSGHQRVRPTETTASVNMRRHGHRAAEDFLRVAWNRVVRWCINYHTKNNNLGIY
jgi:hypothetical protein